VNFLSDLSTYLNEGGAQRQRKGRNLIYLALVLLPLKQVCL